MYTTHVQCITVCSEYSDIRIYSNILRGIYSNSSLFDVDPVARMESFRALKCKDPNGVFSHPKTLTIGEF